MTYITTFLRAMLAAVAVLALAPLPAQAQIIIPGAGANTNSAVSDPQLVAMLQHKFADDPPDFAAWARLDDAWKRASEFDRPTVERQLAASMQQAYSLLTPDETIAVTHTATLSDYSFSNEGYFVESFDSDMFIEVSYAGEHFALIPANIMQYQWMPVSGMAAKKIDDLRQSSATGRDVTMTFHLSPQLAAKDMTVTMEEKRLRLFSVSVKNIAIHDTDGGLIWEARAATAAGDPVRSELLKLYR